MHFYRTLLLVVTKRRKQQSYRRDSRKGWKTQNPLTAHRVKRSLCLNMTQREYLVEEYCAAWKLRMLPVTKETVDAAVRQVYKFLLCDLKPPWVDHEFPQALSGEGVLSRFTRPTFLLLSYSEGMLRSLFGNELIDCVQRFLKVMRLELAGFVARPLYARTNLIDGKTCA